MLKNIIGWIKEHPWMAGAVALGAVILIWLVSRRSSSSSTAATTTTGSTGIGGTGLSEQGYITLQEANLAASQQLQGIQLQAGVQTSAQQDQLQATLGDQATQLSIAQLQANVQSQQILSTASTTDTATQAALTSSLAQTGAQVQEAQIGATEATTIAQFQRDVSLAQIGATNTANNTILQLVGLLTGQNANAAPSSGGNGTTTTTVATVPATQTGSGSIGAVVTSQPTTVTTSTTQAAGAPFGSGSEWQYTTSPTLAQLDEAQALISGESFAQVVATIPQDPSTGILHTVALGFEPAQYQGGPIGGGGYLQINPTSGQVAYQPVVPWGHPAAQPVIGNPGVLA